MDEQLCLLTVHAHPDDEASKGAGTVAKYHAAGVHTVLVTCTGGEEGEILNPAMDTPEVRADIAEVRRRELDRAAEIIGYDEVVLLGYRDSGMPGHRGELRPAVLRRPSARGDRRAPRGRDPPGAPAGDHHLRRRPAVLPPSRPHPGARHLGGGLRRRRRSGALSRHAGSRTSPLKMYYSVWSRARIVATHEKFLELGLESPFDERWLERPSEDDKITTSIDLTGFEDVRRLALLAHATQVDPTSKFWFGLPPEVQRTIHPYDDYILARSLVDDRASPRTTCSRECVFRRADNIRPRPALQARAVPAEMPPAH